MIWFWLQTTLEGSVIIIRSVGGQQCKIPQEVRELGGFSDVGRIVVSRMVLPTKGFTVNLSPVSIYDTECNLQTAWYFRGRIGYLEGFAPLGIAAVVPDQAEIRIVNPLTGQEYQRFQLLLGAVSLHFGASGTLLCAGTYPSLGQLVCYDVHSAKVIARHPSIQGGSPFDVSQRHNRPGQ
jgi:hypothetical protein